MTDVHKILEKYHDIIAQEVNVKEVISLWDDVQITVSYVPLWKELSSSFGKDTWQIIAAAKKGNASLLANGHLKVTNDTNERLLAPHQYEVRYSGLQWDNQIVEDGVVVDLDLTITDDLKAEWYAREISRFLNQMRKDADYHVSDRVTCFWSTEDLVLQNVLTTYTDFLMQEALLHTVQQGLEGGDRQAICTIDGMQIEFVLRR